MATFFMFGKYSSEALREMSAQRTDKAVGLIKKLGGQVNSMYALLGERDLVLIVDFPELEQAIKASVALTKMTGVSFTSSPAVPVEEFDKLIAGI
ncbi:MAG: GYD domain-containing protein [Phycisphaerales bacterium]|nr:MAG: GYD domain-containing protein [Phycisphaerales bacterium]UCF15451.1 MAG: GYD domain-containing protein [Phycisphaerales bacterium]